MGSGGSKHHHGPCGALQSTDILSFENSWATLTTAVDPLHLCHALNGTPISNAHCAVDTRAWLDESENIAHVGQLCSIVGGMLADGAICVIDVTDTPGADAGVEVKRAACEELGGAWEGACVLQEVELAC